MTPLNAVKSFIAKEDGAVTVDWVVLTAAVVGLGAVVGTTVLPGIKTAGTNVVTKLDTKTK